MPFFKWRKKKKPAADTAMTKSGRFIAPTEEVSKTQVSPAAPEPEAPIDAKVKDTIAQIDIDIPGMVVLRSKEERHIARLTEDLKAKEEYTRSFQRDGDTAPPLDNPAAPGAETSTDDDASIVLAANLLLKALMGKGVITPEQADEAEDYAVDNGLSIAEALNHLAILTPQQLGEFIAGECQMPLNNLEELRIHKTGLNILNVNDIRSFELIPLSKVGAVLNIAAVNPINNRLLERLRTEMGYDVKCVICTVGALQNTLRKYYA